MLKRLLVVSCLITSACQDNKANFSPDKGNYFVKTLAPLELEVKKPLQTPHEVISSWRNFANKTTVKAIQDGFLIVGNDEGIIRLYNDKLESLWSMNFMKKARLESCRNYSLALAGDNLVIACESNDLLALNKSGQLLWHKKLSSPLASQPLIVQNLVIVSDNNEDLYAINLVKGDISWVVPGFLQKITTQETWQKLLTYQNNIIQPFAEGGMRAVDVTTSNLQWFFSPQNLEIVKGKVWLPSFNILAKEDNFYYSSNRGEVIALKFGADEPQWIRDYAVSSIPLLLYRDKIILINEAAQLLVVSTQDGKILQSYNLKDFFTEGKDVNLMNRILQPIIYKNKLLVADSNGLLVSFSLSESNIITKTRTKPLSKIINFADQILLESNKDLFLLTVDGI